MARDRQVRRRTTQAEQKPQNIREEEYQLGKVSVWWDAENSHVPKELKVTSLYGITCNIILALKKLGHQGEISIYLYGNCAALSAKWKSAMPSNGVRLIHVPPGKDAVDKRMIVDMMFWAIENPTPETFLLLSGGSDFSKVLTTLHRNNYKIMRAWPKDINLYNLSFTTTLWDLKSLLSGELPMECV